MGESPVLARPSGGGGSGWRRTGHFPVSLAEAEFSNKKCFAELGGVGVNMQMFSPGVKGRSGNREGDG